ncbi:MAG: GNAT family N-acetyltransferase, partial [Methyloligellaceae bacterium]
GQGLGKAIMEAAETWLRARGVWKLNLMVRAENEQAVSFYEALGYAAEERLNLAKWIDPDKKPG